MKQKKATSGRPRSSDKPTGQVKLPSSTTHRLLTTLEQMAYVSQDQGRRHWQIGVQAFAVDDEEQALGLRCIAANIYNEFGEAIAAVSVSGPGQRVSPERVPQIAAQVLSAAAGISHSIGGQPPLETESIKR